MQFGKLNSYSIIKVKWSNGGVRWYQQKSNASIDKIVSRFSNTSGYHYLQIFEYRKGVIGNKVFYHTSKGSFGYN